MSCERREKCEKRELCVMRFESGIWYPASGISVSPCRFPTAIENCLLLNSLFVIRYSLFVIRYSLFVIRYSLFVIRHSLFIILRAFPACSSKTSYH